MVKNRLSSIPWWQGLLLALIWNIAMVNLFVYTSGTPNTNPLPNLSDGIFVFWQILIYGIPLVGFIVNGPIDVFKKKGLPGVILFLGLSLGAFWIVSLLLSI